MFRDFCLKKGLTGQITVAHIGLDFTSQDVYRNLWSQRGVRVFVDPTRCQVSSFSDQIKEHIKVLYVTGQIILIDSNESTFTA